VCATGDDNGRVKLFRWPAFGFKQAYRSYVGHGSHVSQVSAVSICAQAVCDYCCGTITALLRFTTRIQEQITQPLICSVFIHVLGTCVHLRAFIVVPVYFVTLGLVYSTEQVRFSYDDDYLISAGGADMSIFQWRHVVPNKIYVQNLPDRCLHTQQRYSYAGHKPQYHVCCACVRLPCYHGASMMMIGASMHLDALPGVF
jgi:hypothetical protein